MSAPSMVRRLKHPTLLADGRGVVPASPDCRQSRQADAGRSKRVAEIAENAGIDGNEVLECPVIGKSLAETAETPCKCFAREAVRSFTVSPWGQSGRRFACKTHLRQMWPRRSSLAGEEGFYSGTAIPDPPSSAGKSFSLGSPSFIGSTVSE